MSFFKKDPKTVYLKPKNNNIEVDNNNSTNEIQSETDSSKAGVKTISTETTKAYEDDSVIQSDLKTIKQSAVKMSVGQKQEASQILKDWLDDGKSDDTDNNGIDEENN